jgi:hypothetical protein
MTADISTDLSAWSATAGSNQPDYADVVGPNNLADNLRAIQAGVRYQFSSATAASASTVNLAAVPQGVVSISGTTTITALGTVSAGIMKTLIFQGILTFTHNATSLILPGGASITTAAGDVAVMVSEGSGNWRCLGYSRSNGFPVSFGAVLSGVGAATAAATIGNADYAIRWNWALTSASKSAFIFGESSASTGGSGSQFLVDIKTLSASTAEPLRVQARADTRNALLVSRVGNVTISGPALSTGTVDVMPGPSGVLTLGEATGGQVRVRGANGFDVNVTGTSAIDCSTSDLAISGGTIAINPQTLLTLNKDTRLSGNSKLLVQDAAGSRPALTSGFGTGASINGSDSACVVTIGTSASAGMTLTWDVAFTNAPIIQVCSDQAGITFSAATSTTTATITASSAMTSGKRLFITTVGYTA